MNSSPMLEVGNLAPLFELPAFPLGQIRLQDFRGQENVVLYFYPRDNTPGCTTESCDFRDQWSQFQAAGTTVLGVSGDPVDSHRKFGEKFSFPFTLLSDVDHAVAEQYGVWVEKTNYGKKYMGIQRATFLIDRKGKIAAIWPKVKVNGHASAVLEAVAELK